MDKNFLEIVDLKKGFGSGETRQEVLRGMNFTVAKGEFCVLLGPSGSGKSTLLNIIGGIDQADSGYISINGDKLEEMGVISRKNMYKIENQTKRCSQKGSCMVELEDNSVYKLTSKKWKKVMEAGLEACGYAKKGQHVKKIII